MFEPRTPQIAGSRIVPRAGGPVFRPVAVGDLGLLGDWLHRSHVRRWWDAPQDQLGRIGERIGSPRIAQEIVSLDGVPFGYVQHYRLADWPGRPAVALPEGARGVDLLIGPAEALGRGLGSALLRALTGRLFAEGVPALAADPDTANIAAVRAFRRAGFREGAVAADGSIPMVIPSAAPLGRGTTDERPA